MRLELILFFAGYAFGLAKFYRLLFLWTLYANNSYKNKFLQLNLKKTNLKLYKNETKS